MPTPQLPDYSEWLIGDRLVAEDRAWGETAQYRRNVSQVLRAIRDLDQPAPPSTPAPPLVVELGCGSGWMPLTMSNAVRYHGIDKSPALILLSQGRNNGTRARFHRADLRDVTPAALAALLYPDGPAPDLVYSFSVLKHFSLAEWEAIFRGVLALGTRLVLQLQTTTLASFDDGVEYHHTWINEGEVERYLADAGCVVRWREETMHDGPLSESTFYIERRCAS